MKTIIPTLFLAALPFAALADAGIAVEDAYARGANPKSGAAFMLIENRGNTDCTLTSVSSDVAKRVELHSNTDVNGVMKMEPLSDGIKIPAGGEHHLKRGSDHVMMMGLTAPLEDGQSVKMTLDFGDCGMQELEIPVDNKRAEESEDMEDHDHGHEHDDH